MPEDDCAVPFIMLIDHDRAMDAAEKPLQRLLARLDGRSAEIFAVELEQISLANPLNTNAALRSTTNRVLQL